MAHLSHEMLDPVGLVHMNGRVYDPELGRFLSADPNVQDTTNLQAWNRYSYVLNNPLSYTDPSGFFFKSIFKAVGKIFGAVFKAVGAVLKAVLKIPLLRSAIQIVACSPFAVGATFGASCAAVASAFTLAAGGSIGDALIAAAVSFAQVGAGLGSGFEGIWTAVGGALDGARQLGAMGFAAVKSAVHGTIGGALSLAQGGNFLEGFASSAIGAAAGQISGAAFGGTPGIGGFALRTAVAAVAGGAAAAAAGGKFATGAITAAFAHMFNAEAGDWPERFRRINLQHSEGVALAIKDLQERGFTIVWPRESSIAVPGMRSPRRYDFIVSDTVRGERRVFGVEVKTTIGKRIYLKKDQVAKDVLVHTKGGRSLRHGTINRVLYMSVCTGCSLLDYRTNQLREALLRAGIQTRICSHRLKC